MTFEVIGTGSKGNCYLLTVNGQTLVIEVGVNFTTVKKHLNFDLSGIVGVLVSHEHGDHAKFVKDFQKFGKSIYCTFGTSEGIKITNYREITSYSFFEVGLFKITPFEVQHDAKEPVGFLIEFEGERLVFLTDSCDLTTRIKNVDYWIIEANYSAEKLQRSLLDPMLKKRIQNTHMSIDRCKTILDAHNAENSKLVLLIHGSDKHSDYDEFLTKIPYANIATNNLIIDL